MITLTGEDTLKTTTYNKQKGILYYGEDNKYPNYNRIFSNNSPALKRSLMVWEKFVFGQGFDSDANFWKLKVNAAGLRVDQMLRKLVVELGAFGGFAVHVGYNGATEKKTFTPIKFDTLRLGEPDDFGIIKKIKRYKDWAATRIITSDIQEYDVYNPDPEIILSQVERAGGWDKYKGQIFYFGANGEISYPHAIFHSVIEDIVTDIKMKNGRNANASTNFMPSHILQVPFLWSDIASKMSTSTGEKITAEEVETAFKENLQKFQSADNIGKLAVIQNGMKDNEGKMIKFEFEKLEMQNYDKVFELTGNIVKDTIRGVFSIPPILLEEVSTGFSNEIMSLAYNYYNNMTSYYRLIFEETFTELFSNYFNPSVLPISYKITPLKYISDEQETTNI